MPKRWTFLAGLLLLTPPPPTNAVDEAQPAPTTLQQITREAEERLAEWDRMDLQEQELESKYWWLGLIELAASLALRHDPFADLQVRGWSAKSN